MDPLVILDGPVWLWILVGILWFVLILVERVWARAIRAMKLDAPSRIFYGANRRAIVCAWISWPTLVVAVIGTFCALALTLRFHG